MSALFPFGYAGSGGAAGPDAPALIDVDRRWTYAEVAGAVAKRVAGFTGDGLIAVATSRTAAGIIGVLAAAASGRPFLAVDAALPPARQRQLASEAGASAPDGAAYVVYTSGSTGTPKGVVVGERGLRHIAEAQRAILDVGPGARVFQMAAVSFDAFLFEMLMAFGSGAALVLPGPRAVYPGPDLTARLRATHVTHLVATPTALRALDPQDLTDLRVVCSVGERCTPDVRDGWRPGRRLLNLYGPAEASIWVTYRELDGDTDPAGIGRPIDGVRALILDDASAPVGDGEVGQLFVAGPTVALGYLNRPDLTAQKFPTLPDGTRAYATGDRVRRAPDGSLDFLGRVDDQVKIQGARVEPAEVQAVLSALPGVAGAVVVPIPAPDGSLVLAAAFAGSATVDDIAGVLRARLPRWMVPSVLRRLEAIPISANGKTDRAAIVAALTRPATATEVARGGTPLEDLILREARDLLDRPGLAGTDDFFAAGGNSMLALQLAVRVGDALGIELDLARLFAADRLATWVEDVEAQVTGGGARSRPAVRAIAPEDAQPSIGQAEILAAERYLGGSAAYVSTWCEHVTGEFDPDAFSRALHDAAQAQETLRTRYVLGADGMRSVTDATASVEVRRHVCAAVADARAVVEEACRRPYHLERDQPVRAVLVSVEPAGHLVAVMVHHVACDAVSFHDLLADVWARYDGTAHATAPSAPYRDFAGWQAAFMTSPAGRDQRAWWGERLRGLAPLRLGDRDTIAARTGHRIPFTIDAQHIAAIEELCASQRVSPFAVLSGAYAVALAPYLSDTERVIGTPVTARGSRRFEHTFGYFVSMLPLPLDRPVRGTTGQWLRAWAATCVDVVARRDLPFAEAARAWAETSPASGRLATVFALNYVTPPVAAHRRRVRLDPGLMKFDLLLTIDLGPREWTGELAYDAGVLAAAEAEELLERVRQAIGALPARLDDPVADLAGAVTAPAGATFDFGALV
jgi:non-ribosomal peptide synthetase component F